MTTSTHATENSNVAITTGGSFPGLSTGPLRPSAGTAPNTPSNFFSYSVLIGSPGRPDGWAASQLRYHRQCGSGRGNEAGSSIRRR